METEAIHLPYILAGLALGLLGWVIYWAGLPIIAGVVGAGAGASLGYMAAGVIQAEWAPPFLVGAGMILGGFLGVVLMRALQVFFFFIVGASLGGAGMYHLVEVGFLRDVIAPPPSLEGFAAIAAGALVLGVLMIKLRRFVVAVVTSVIGAAIFTAGLPPHWQPAALPISVIVFLAIQVGLVRKFVREEHFDYRARQDMLRRGRTRD